MYVTFMTAICQLVNWTHCFSVQNKTIKVTNEEIKELDYEFSGNRVTDLSVLPNVMRPYCQGKPIFWAQPSDQTAKGELYCSLILPSCHESPHSSLNTLITLVAGL